MGKIRQELMDAAGIAPKRGEAELAFIVRLQNAISKVIDEATWNGLSAEAQDWNNDAADDIEGGNNPRAFPDEDQPAIDPAAAPVAPARRGRGAAAAPPPVQAPEPVPVDPAVGDVVTASTKRNKVVEGTVVAIEDGVVYINADGEAGDKDKDESVPLAGTTFILAAEEEPEAEEVEAEAPATPQEGDTVEAVTKRDKAIVGIVMVIDGDDLVLKDLAGVEHELVISALKSVKVKLTKAPAPAAKTARARSAAPAPTAAPAETTGRRSTRPAVSDGDDKPPTVGVRVRQLVCAKPDITLEAVEKALKAEKYEWRGATVQMCVKDTKSVIDMLRAAGALK